MSQILKLVWATWVILFIFGIIGTIAFFQSTSPKKVALLLEKDQAVHLSVFRVLPHRVVLFMKYDHGTRNVSAEIEDDKNLTDLKDDDVSAQPREEDTVTLKVSSKNGETLYKALPGSDDRGPASMKLVPLNPSRKGMAPGILDYHPLPVGRSDLSITVIKTGPALAGQKATLILQAPIQFKFVDPNYSWLAKFYFWPLLLFLFFGSWIVLMVLSISGPR